MRSEQGYTLVEILAAIAILAMISLSFSYVFTKAFEHSYQEETEDLAVGLARKVMETLKQSVQNGNLKAEIFGQTVDLAVFASNPSQAILLHYPDENPEYEIRIRKKAPGDRYFVIKGRTLDLEDYVTLIQVEVKHIGYQRSFILENYLEFSSKPTS